MNVSNRCWNVLLNESAENGVFIDANSPPITYASLNLDSTESKILYLFKYSPYHVLLSKTSIIDFAYKVPGGIEMLNSLCSKENLCICSVSSGLGEDVIGFLYAVKELNVFQKGLISVGLINKHESCCQTAKHLFDAHVNLNGCNSFEYLQCDPLTTWTTAAEHYLAQADAVFLSLPFVKYINKSSVFMKFLRHLLEILKSGAVVFCLFQKKQDEFFRSKEFSSFIMNNPLEVLVSHVPFNDLVVEIVGKTPILSGSCCLTVLKFKDLGIPKSPSIPNLLKTNQDELKKTFSSSFVANEASISESNQNVPDSSMSVTRSDSLLTSLLESLNYLSAVFMKCKDSPNFLPETRFSKNEAVRMDSLVSALKSLEESLKSLCCILKKCPLSVSMSSDPLTLKVEKELSTLMLNDREDQSDNTDSNDPLGLLVQSLNNLIDRLEVN